MIRFSASDMLGGQVPLADFDGYGYVASAIPSDGDSGGSVLANDGLNVGASYEYLALLVAPPTTGTLDFGWDGTFEYAGPSTTFTYQLYENGVAIGAPQLVTLNLGGAEVKVWTGSVNVAAEPKAYVGGGWVPVTIKVWDGGAWV